jgi:hypothetical protein
VLAATLNPPPPRRRRRRRRAAAAPTLHWDVEASPAPAVSLLLDGVPWLVSTAPTACVSGSAGTTLSYNGSQPVSGSDGFGAFAGTAVTWAAAAPGSPRVVVEFRAYAAAPSLATAVVSFPDGLDTSGCGSGGLDGNVAVSAPAWNASAGQLGSLGFLTWATEALSKTPTSLGLAGLPVNALDVGPIVAFPAGQLTPESPSLVWSSLSSHKIVTHALTKQPQPGPITALWSQSRADQIACLSATCTADQQPDGSYASQRVEGYGLVADGAPPPPAQSLSRDGGGGHRWRVVVTGAVGEDGSRHRATAASVIPLGFAWSQQATDNWVGTNSTPPDGTYTFRGANGYVFADGSVPGTIPLQVRAGGWGGGLADRAQLKRSSALRCGCYTATSWQCVACCSLCR